MAVDPWLEAWRWNPDYKVRTVYGCRNLAVESWLWNPGCGILAVESRLCNPGYGILAVEVSGGVWRHQEASGGSWKVSISWLVWLAWLAWLAGAGQGRSGGLANRRYTAHRSLRKAARTPTV